MMKLSPIINEAIQEKFPHMDVGDEIENNNQDEFADLGEFAVEGALKDTISSALTDLKNAKTLTNSKEYKALLESTEKLKKNLEKGHGPNPDLFEQVVSDMESYYAHKARKGVAPSAFNKLSAVENLYKVVNNLVDDYAYLGIRRPNFPIEDRTFEELAEMNVKDDPMKTKKIENLTSAFKRLQVVGKEEQFGENVENQISFYQDKLKRFAKESYLRADELDDVCTCLTVAEKQEPAVKTLEHGVKKLAVYLDQVMDDERTPADIVEHINASIPDIQKNLELAKTKFQPNDKIQKKLQALDTSINALKDFAKKNTEKKPIKLSELAAEENGKETGRKTVGSKAKGKSKSNDKLNDKSDNDLRRSKTMGK